MATDRGTDPGPPLAGLHVLVTRPTAFADALCAALLADGACVHRAPLLTIEPVPENPALRALAQNLDSYDVVIVTSRNAVQCGMPLLAPFWPQWPVAQRWFAVGAATAAALAAHGVDATAPADARSEGLLALAALADVAGQHVLLVTGEGGRGMIEDVLAERGAVVTRFAVYRRIFSTDVASALDSFHQSCRDDHRDQIHAVLVTSSEALQNLLGAAPWLADSRVLVVAASARIAVQARAAGIGTVVVADGADDTHMMAALHRRVRGAMDNEAPA